MDRGGAITDTIITLRYEKGNMPLIVNYPTT